MKDYFFFLNTDLRHQKFQRIDIKLVITYSEKNSSSRTVKSNNCKILAVFYLRALRNLKII